MTGQCEKSTPGRSGINREIRYETTWDTTVGQTVTLRYDPDAPPARPIEVVHHAKPAGTATRLDAYANTRVKRHRPSSQLLCSTPAREPDPSPLAMRHLKEKK